MQSTRGFPIAGGVIRIGGGVRIVPPVPVLEIHSAPQASHGGSWTNDQVNLGVN